MKYLFQPFMISTIFLSLAIIGYYGITFFLGKAYNAKSYIPFINEYPLHYVGVVSGSLFLSLLIFNKNFMLNKGIKNFYNLFKFILLWFFFSCILGGILWTYHDMGDSNYIGTYSSFISKAISEIGKAFILAPATILFAFPYNIFCLITLFYSMKKIYGLKISELN